MSAHPCDPALELTVEEAARGLRVPGHWRLVDCREPDEHALCRIEGAEPRPLSRQDEWFPDCFPARDERILVCCHHGLRSLRTVRFLQAHGHAQARSLHGGIDAWARLVDPGVPRY